MLIVLFNKQSLHQEDDPTRSSQSHQARGRAGLGRDLPISWQGRSQHSLPKGQRSQGGKCHHGRFNEPRLEKDVLGGWTWFASRSWFGRSRVVQSVESC